MADEQLRYARACGIEIGLCALQASVLSKSGCQILAALALQQSAAGKLR